MCRFIPSLISFLSLISLALVLSACGSPSRLDLKNNFIEQEIFQDQLFDQPSDILTLKEVFALTPEQKQHFLSRFRNKDYRDLSDSQRIFKYLKNHLENFNFHSDTLIASDAMAMRAGNCMSLVILTKAISQLTHVGINYELARTPPVYQRENNLEMSSQHIRAVVYNKTTKNTKQFLKPNDRVKIDYFSTAGSRTLRKVKTNELYSLFYSNRAAEAMLKDDNNQAYWLIKEALKYKDDNLIAINILGVLYDRINKTVFAERAFLYGLQFGGDQLELLNNYHQFLVISNRLDEAKIIAETLDNYDDPDPFKWLDLADKELNEGHYLKAIGYYQKAIEKASYLHQPYAGLAKANFLLGRKTKALEAIELALQNAHSKRANTIYQAKYDYLKSH